MQWLKQTTDQDIDLMRAAQPPVHALLPENDFEDCTEREWCTEALQTASALAASHAAGLILAAGTSGMC